MHEDQDKLQGENRREELLRRAAQSYRQPPETPRERIWTELRARRLEEAGETPPESPLTLWQRFGRALRTLWWPLAAAGLLLVGIWMGRQLETAPNTTISEEPATEMAAAESVTGAHPAVDEAPRGDLLKDSLTQNVEALLMLVSSETPGFEAGGNEALADWARELLLETRLLLGSPHGEDSQIGALLLDLEFVLIQLVRQDRPDARESNEWILDNIRRKDLLIRLRHTHSQPPTAGV